VFWRSRSIPNRHDWTIAAAFSLSRSFLLLDAAVSVAGRVIILNGGYTIAM
jgi:hypothetical protein